MDTGAATMYDPHAAHRPPGIQGVPSHHSPHMSHGSTASVGIHGYHGHGAPSHVSPVSNHVMGNVPDVHKRDKDAIYGWVLNKTFFFFKSFKKP